ncbi:type II secretion system minor pseudopilin GspJ [Vibrio sp. S11_S32]|uniref:type II secretion system minor pseudopilin GspJ n=1 Tax=Vibrio sp. S11_S32 TaxID=2720225 RepID=UPI001681A0F0|nr:type II secretion system minor pseudopilin GspJ [Vibrio sp. S11_S32]MBD1576009.1 type II secretion system minor pseudopilin GspJ [Vibrio sp. S11_S32]
MLNRNRINKFRHNLSGGFTLIEVMVAIMVFASLSLGAYQVVNQVQRSNQVSLDKTQRLQELQRAMIVMDSDFRQMALRKFSFGDKSGTEKTKPLYTGQYVLDSDSDGIVFTRLGWLNPQQAFPRGEIVKVGYRIIQGKLERVWWRYPDTPTGQEPLHKVVLSQVEKLDFGFYDGSNWQKEWTKDSALPQAIEVKLQLKDYGDIRRVYLIAQSNVNSSDGGDNDSSL